MGKSQIQWTDKTWNPVRGCSRVSPGCLHCYAEKIATRFSDPGQAFHTFAQRTPQPHWTGKVELVEEKLSEPLHWRKPSRVFVNSMSDLFHEGLSNEEIRRVFEAICCCRGRHVFQILTKRAERMLAWLEWVRPLEPGWFSSAGTLDLWQTWLGVSVENADNKHRIDTLRKVPAVVRFLSLEPLLEDLGELDLSGIDWVIVGGESGPGARPCDIAWIRSIKDQCNRAGVACFVKQLGANPYKSLEHAGATGYNLAIKNRKGGDMSEWPADLRERAFPAS